ncbi:MAG TPA: site-specific DNA-methyltransferase, partial [Polymorphobacter sp.]|nr:site-specific DNA-methyltransferase [Polymorphobacter sp.]
VTQSARSAPRVAFGALVENGMIRPGTELVDHARRFRARVQADGSLNMDESVGSIHQIGAAAQKAPACNGWTFWHVEQAGKLVPIDTMRAAYRQAAAS